MTDPLLDDLSERSATRLRRVARELVGLLLVVLGAVALCLVLATVDWRLAAGLAAAACVATGLWLGSGQSDIEGS